jgi:hypothetical protein
MHRSNIPHDKFALLDGVTIPIPLNFNIGFRLTEGCRENVETNRFPECRIQERETWAQKRFWLRCPKY